MEPEGLLPHLQEPAIEVFDFYVFIPLHRQIQKCFYSCIQTDTELLMSLSFIHQ
jgi:hypothetical protein